MIVFLIRRLVQSLVVVVGVTIIVFILVHLLPGGPARAELGGRATPQQVHLFIVQNGYDRPIYIQYGKFVDHLLHGDLGYSYHYNQTVDSLLEQDLPKSALLVGLAYAAALILAVPIGILQAVRRNSWIDYLLTSGAFVGYSMPVFWLGIILILFLAVSHPIFPAEAPQGSTVGAILGQPSGLVLPVATLAIVNLAMFSRFMRGAAIENLVQDYIRTARAKGVPEWLVLSRHLLRNSLIPIITLAGMSLPIVLSGAVVAETVFNYPGMGLLFWTAAQHRDYPVLMGFTLVVGVATVLGNLLADVVYAAVDPRVRYA